MKKRIISLLMAAVMACMLFGCQSNDPVQSTTKPAGKDYPLVTGTFMQPWAFKGYDQARMKEHLGYLKDVGIELLIIQSTFDVKSDSNTPDIDQDFLETVFSSAKSLNMRIFIGLANDGNWWKKLFTDQQWLDDHVAISLQGAKAIYEGFKSRYPDTFAGWYFWPEYWNMDLDEEQTARGAKFLSDYRDGLYDIDITMPMLMSPYITDSVDAAGTQAFWTQILSASTLREGDMFCCQDSVGAGHVELEQLDGYFAAMKAAVDTKPGLQFMANNEDFTPDFKSADMARFLRQLEITHKYADVHISFSFCHYRNPDTGKTNAYQAYQYYYQHGKLATSAPAMPQVQVESELQGMYVNLKVNVENADGNIHSVVITKDHEIVYTKVLDGQRNFTTTYTDLNMNTPLCQRFYTVYTVDYNGNMSEEFTEFVNVFTMGM